MRKENKIRVNYREGTIWRKLETESIEKEQVNECVNVWMKESLGKGGRRVDFYDTKIVKIVNIYQNYKKII